MVMSLDKLLMQSAIFETEYAVGEYSFVYHCCRLALNSLQQGSYGVAALLYDSQGKILAESGNQVFKAGYHSAAHAEMQVIDLFEQRFPNYQQRQELTLLVTLEPCPICYCRILAAGIGRLHYIVDDPDGGMVSRTNKLPPAWQNLSQLCTTRQISLPDELYSWAEGIAFSQRSALRNKLMRHIR